MIKLVFIAILFVIFSLNDFVKSESVAVTATEILEKANIIDKAKEIFNSIKESDLYKTGKSISKWAKPLLGAIGSFAKIIMAQFESDSKELTFMKEQFKILNEKMDYVDQQFEEVKRLMDWNVVKIQYGKYEINTNILQHLIQTTTETPFSIRYIVVEKFLLTFEQIYENVAENIYQGFMNQNKIFSDNLILAIRKYTKDHRYQMERFFMGNLQLILKCLEVESFYLNLKNFTSVEKIWQDKWSKRLDNLTNIMQTVSEKVTENWDQQSKIDIEEFNVENSQKSHENYANDLYRFLNDKFRNRIWLVLVYDPLDSDYDHAVKVCNGISQMQSRGHNIVVSSIPFGTRELNKDYYTSICSEMSHNIGSWGQGPPQYVLNRHLGPKIDCSVNQIGAVIKSEAKKMFLAPYDRLTGCQWGGYYNRFFDFYITLDLIVLG